MDNAPLSVVQISDIHLFADRDKALLGVKTQESFQAVVDLLQREAKKIDLILLTGDLAQDGAAKSYIEIANILQSFSVPVYFVPGNHDDIKTMAQVYPRANISSHKHIVLKNWHIILLDSQRLGKVEGHLDTAQLTYMQHCLQTYPEHNAIIVMHHQPVAVGSAWLDKLGVDNAEEFWQIVANYPKVNAVLFGHVHQEYESLVDKIKCYALPSTCIQFMPHKKTFALEDIPPGYRWLNLYENGCIETGVSRVATYVGTFEAKARGY